MTHSPSFSIEVWLSRAEEALRPVQAGARVLIVGAMRGAVDDLLRLAAPGRPVTIDLPDRLMALEVPSLFLPARTGVYRDAGPSERARLPRHICAGPG
jgi:hypothetical protein